VDVLGRIYGEADWSAVERSLREHPGDPGNPNVVLITISLSNVELNRFERNHDITDWIHAAARLEWVVRNYDLWGNRWLTAPILTYLDVTAFRLVREPFGAPELVPVADGVWNAVMQLTREEANARLIERLPYLPYDSAETGDSKAEEDAWEAGLLAAAANFLAEDPSAAAWESKARELAYDAITSPEDSPYPHAPKVVTVPEDFQLANHGFFPNPTYMAATLVLLRMGALTYRLTGRTVPPEFEHNTDRLYAAYSRLVRDDLTWSVRADPEGDATLFPLDMDPTLEDRVARAKEARGDLWVEVADGASMDEGEELWRAVLNAKVVMFYLVGSYLWHVPEPDAATVSIAER
jgi:hypothetical protein